MHQSVVPAGKGPGVWIERPGGLQGRDVVGGLVGVGLMLEVRTDLITCCCHAVFLLPGRLHVLSPVRGGHIAIQQMEKLRVPGQEGQTSGIYGCARVGHRAGEAAGLPRGEELLGAAPPPASHAPPAQPAAAALQS